MIPLLQLDDIRYDQLTQEALAAIPRLTSTWTDFNPSDPGITLVELFAWLTDMLVFRLNQITDEDRWNYLWLLNGPDWVPPIPRDQPGALEEATRTTVRALRQPSRAVTTADYEYLVINTLPGWAVQQNLIEETAQISSLIGRVRALGETNLDAPASSSSSSSSASPLPAARREPAPSANLEPLSSSQALAAEALPSTIAPPRRLAIAAAPRDNGISDCAPLRAKGHVSVVIVPDDFPPPPSPTPSSSSSSSSSSDNGLPPWVVPDWLLQDAITFLDGRRMLTTHVHVDSPRVAFLRVQAALFLYPNVSGPAVCEAAIARLLSTLHPITGGPEQTGWPFDRNLYVSDLYQLLQDVPGVNFVNTKYDPTPSKTYLRLDIIGTAGPTRCSPADGVNLVDMSCFDVLWLTSDNCHFETWEPVGYPLGSNYVRTV